MWLLLVLFIGLYDFYTGFYEVFKRGLVLEINSYIKRLSWLDFQIESCDGHILTFKGYIDFSEPYKIEIDFIDVFAILSTSVWHTNTQKDSLRILKNDQAKDIMYRISD